MTVRLLEGDCRETLPTLEAGSVHTVITSPPYWGLRDYGTPPLVWGGDPQCAHTFEGLGTRTKGGASTNGTILDGRDLSGWRSSQIITQGSRCVCGAWRGSLGLEPTPELYVEHMVEVFRHVWRVLRDDGSVWLNLGDSYAGSGNGAHDYRERNKNRSLSLHPEKYVGQSTRALQRAGPQEHTEGNGRVQGAKPKDLLEIPSDVVRALKADGWYLRSRIPWLKRNSMPESVTDRPATSVEYVFLLSKSRKYFWDADAVRVKSAPETQSQQRRQTSKRAEFGKGIRNNADFMVDEWKRVESRNRRNSDWFFESWQGLLTDDDGDPLALVVNPAPFSGAHFATFPPKLVEPMLKASTSEKGCCAECGAPSKRVTKTEYVKSPVHGEGSQIRNRAEDTDVNGWAGMPRVARRDTTLGWQPSCAHTGEPVPCTALDPFGGAGTVGLVADRMGRDAILCELKPDYADMGTTRVQQDAPLFHGVPIQPISPPMTDKQSSVGNRTYTGFNERWEEANGDRT
jgi:DNA modification methylase